MRIHQSCRAVVLAAALAQHGCGDPLATGRYPGDVSGRLPFDLGGAVPAALPRNAVVALMWERPAETDARDHRASGGPLVSVGFPRFELRVQEEPPPEAFVTLSLYADAAPRRMAAARLVVVGDTYGDGRFRYRWPGLPFDAITWPDVLLGLSTRHGIVYMAGDEGSGTALFEMRDGYQIAECDLFDDASLWFRRDCVPRRVLPEGEAATLHFGPPLPGPDERLPDWPPDDSRVAPAVECPALSGATAIAIAPSMPTATGPRLTWTGRGYGVLVQPVAGTLELHRLGAGGAPSGPPVVVVEGEERWITEADLVWSGGRHHVAWVSVRSCQDSDFSCVDGPEDAALEHAIVSDTGAVVRAPRFDGDEPHVGDVTLFAAGNDVGAVWKAGSPNGPGYIGASLPETGWTAVAELGDLADASVAAAWTGDDAVVVWCDTASAQLLGARVVDRGGPGTFLLARQCRGRPAPAWDGDGLIVAYGGTITSADFRPRVLRYSPPDVMRFGVEPRVLPGDATARPVVLRRPGGGSLVAWVARPSTVLPVGLPRLAWLSANVELIGEQRTPHDAAWNNVRALTAVLAGDDVTLLVERLAGDDAHVELGLLRAPACR